MLGDQAVQVSSRPQNAVGVNLNVRRLSPNSSGPRLVDENFGMRKGVPFARRPSEQEDRSHGSREPYTGGRHIRLDHLHCVVDGEPRRCRTTR
ncbi:hypothetical protein D3C73_1453870 [compost metagenome]